MYLTYDEFEEYGGDIDDEAVYVDYEFGAEAIIDYMTFGRLSAFTTIPDEVKRLTYYLITLAKKKADSLSLGNDAEVSTGAYIRNQSNDGVSITYSGMASADLYKNCTAEAQTAVTRYLANVKDSLGRRILYRGLYPGE